MSFNAVVIMPPSLSKTYLLLYNSAQFSGWTYLLVRSAPLLLPALFPGSSTASSSSALFSAVWVPLSLFQTSAVLEVLHAALGLVRSNPILTAFQLFSRVVITWVVLGHFPEGQSCRGLPLLLLAWEVTEVVRYSYYSLALLDSVPHMLTWMRYSLFIILYPMGVTGELWCAISCLGTVRRERPWSLTMPNTLNTTFDSYVVAILLLLSYIPIFPQLYFHMVAQRKKVLAVPAKKTD